MGIICPSSAWGRTIYLFSVLRKNFVHRYVLYHLWLMIFVAWFTSGSYLPDWAMNIKLLHSYNYAGLEAIYMIEDFRIQVGPENLHQALQSTLQRLLNSS